MTMKLATYTNHASLTYDLINEYLVAPPPLPQSFSGSATADMTYF